MDTWKGRGYWNKINSLRVIVTHIDNPLDCLQIQNLSQRGINLDGIKIIYEMKDKIEELQNKLIYLENEISNQKIDSKNKEKEIHQSYKNEIVKKSNNSLKKNI